MTPIKPISLVCAGILLSAPAFAKSGDIKASVAYSQTDSSFTPSTGNANKSDSDTFSVSVNYELNDKLTLAANFSQTDGDTVGTNNTITSSSNTDLLGLTATYKLTKNVSIFGGYSFGNIDIDTVVTPGTLFFSNDIDLDVYVAGVSYFNVINRNAFYGVTGVVSYASTDLSAYVLQTSLNGRPGNTSSVTTMTFSPVVGYKAGKMLYTFTYSHNMKNRAGGAEPDRISGKAKLGLKYSINKAASIGFGYSEVVSKAATDSDTFDLNFSYKF